MLTFFPFVTHYRRPVHMPGSPYPADGASGQSPNVFLQWKVATAASDTFRYNLILEANNSQPSRRLNSEPLTQPAFDPFTLKSDTTYSWRVQVIDSLGNQSLGPVWTFRTEDMAAAAVLSAMVTIPAGEYRMGCDGANPEEECFADELPLHTVYLDAYQIDKYEVTISEYRACVAAGACTAPSETRSRTHTDYYVNPVYREFPVIYVSWQESVDYCAWQGKRLPTEAEWEKAYRGTIDTRKWPWGDRYPDCSFMNHHTGLKYCEGDTTQVGSYPQGASPYGVMDMGGNVFEWVHDYYDPDYYAVSAYENPQGSEIESWHVIRGGSYRPRIHYNRIAFRHFGHHGDAQFRNDQVGFRCARSIDISKREQ